MRWLAALSLFGLFACGAKESPLRGETQALLADHEDIMAIELEAQNVGASLIAADTMTIAPDSQRFPGPCLTVEKISATSQILHLRGCGTPALRGDLVIQWEVRALALKVDVSTKEFFIGSTFIRSGTISADVTAIGMDRTMVWETHLDGVLRSDTKPRTFSRDAFMTMRWTVGTPCVTTDGTSIGAVEDRKVRSTFTGFRLCSGMRCPAPNSRVRVDNLVTNQSIDVRFAPQGHAVIIDVNGKLLPIKPVCARLDQPAD